MTTEVSLNQNFDELFIKAEKEPQAAFIHLSLTGIHTKLRLAIFRSDASLKFKMYVCPSEMFGRKREFLVSSFRCVKYLERSCYRSYTRL